MDQGPGLGVSLGLSNVSEAQTSKIVNRDSGLHDLYSLVTVNQRGQPPQPHHGGETGNDIRSIVGSVFPTK